MRHGEYLDSTTRYPRHVSTLDFYALCAQVIPVFLVLIALEARSLHGGSGGLLRGGAYVLGFVTIVLGLAAEGICLLGTAGLGNMTDQTSRVIVNVALIALLFTTLILLTNIFFEGFQNDRRGKRNRA